MRVIVVGGGVLGASAAFHLAGLGAETLLVETADTGRATSAGAGIICPWASRVEDPDHYRLTRAAAAAYPALMEELAALGAGNPSYRRCGALLPLEAAALEAEAARIAPRIAASPEAGGLERLSGREAQALFPALGDDKGALFIPGAARVDGRQLSAALAEGARRRGATILPGRAQPWAEGGRMRGVELDGEKLPADAVICAGGVWATAWLAPLGVALPVRVQRGQIIHLRIPGAAARGWPVILPLTGFYIVTFDDDRIVVGASREEGTGMDYRMTAGGVAQVLAAGMGIAPGLAAATIEEVRIGFRPMPPAWRPVIGPAPGVAGLFVANGLGANGLTMGPEAGRLVARAALGLPADLAPYALR